MSFVFLLAVLSARLIAQDTATNDNQQWISLFNGKDLSGWTVKCHEADQNKSYWKFKDGAILCDTEGDKDHGAVLLQYERVFADFELKLRFKAYTEPPGNSGLQIRSRFDSSADAPQGGWMDGPQVDIHPPTSWRTGLIYDQTRGVSRWLFPDLPNSGINESQGAKTWRFNAPDDPQPWNDLLVRCQGTRITTTVNGLIIADFDGEGILDDEVHAKHSVGLSGFIALQLHAGDDLKIYFKDIYVRKL